jgi:CheY-like chemotaxis protein/HPt (histidine-containing phosphotransfer) domain-containing protein
MTALLLDTELTPEQRHFAEAARDSGGALLQIINDILDWSKIEANKLEMEQVRFDVYSLVDDVAAVVAAPAHAKGLELCCWVDPAVPAWLIGDPWRLRQILVNLAGNAVKFTNKGEVSIRASIDEESDGGCLLRFSVRDTGIGIPPCKMDQLFASFTQADATTTREFGGTGLGLAISRRLAERMGGQIGVHSEMEVGSEFWVTVKLGKAADLAENEESAPGLEGTRVLVVDDNATARTAVCSMAGHWGMRTEEASSGPRALEALRQADEENDPFALALVDTDMSGMDGVALASAVERDARLSRTRAIFLKPFGVRRADSLAPDFAARILVTKPVRSRELQRALSRALTAGPGCDPAVEKAKKRDAAPGGDAEFCFHPSNRLLLAEDNRTNREVALAILKKFGVAAEAVVNGAQAVKALETIAYDLVLMDVRMPEMDGIEATRRIRDPRSAVLNHDVPVIALTATVLEAEKKLCLDAGMNGFVAKPVLPSILHAELSRYLRTQPAVKRAEPNQDEKAPAGCAPRIFDREGLLCRTLSDRELAAMVVAAFLQDFPKGMGDMRERLERRDSVAAGRCAHSIKGAAASAGAESLSRTALEIETAIDAGDLAAAELGIENLERTFRRFREVVCESDVLVGAQPVAR